MNNEAGERPGSRAGIPWTKFLAVALAGVGLVVFLYSLPYILIVVAAWPRTVLTERHRDPPFTLYVTEQTFFGTTHEIHYKPRRSLFREGVADVFAGDWFDTPSIGSESLRFEWHEDDRLVALVGSEEYGRNEDVYLALLTYDDTGAVSEVEIHVEGQDRVGGDHWGGLVRAARSEKIEAILHGESGRGSPGGETVVPEP